MSLVGFSFGGTLSRIVEGLRRRVRAVPERITSAGTVARQLLGFREPEDRLIGDSQIYWNKSADELRKQNSHWRGVGIFADDLRWLTIGKGHLELYEQFSRVVKFERRIERVVEWGCGGGMNAVHFARLASEFVGIDISGESLEECKRQMTMFGLSNFRAVLIKASDPEAVLEEVQLPCDLLISTYVFELLPTREYGFRVLRIAYQLLAPGGLAMIQIKYSEGDKQTWSRPWAYARNLAWNVTYRIEEFWLAAQACGFTPKMVTLLPAQPLVNDRNYAYFFLEK
jgi:SAM-dependent methyltransferase